MIDYINEDTFHNLTKYRLNTQWGMNFDYELLKQNSIIYCHTNHLEFLFNTLKFVSHKYLLITHGSDYPINIMRFNSRPECISKWFARDADYKHSDIIPIPVGINPENPKSNIVLIRKLIDNIESLRSNEKRKDELFCGWRVSVSPQNRSHVLNDLKMPYLWKSDISYDQYLDIASRHRYIISPPGNGLDCHRTWDALYMGCVPIVISHLHYDEFSELPILQVKNYSEVTPELLENFEKRSFNYEKMYMTYWKDRILLEFKKLNDE